MGKIKLNKKDNYTIISNSVLKNKNLSLKAKGLYAYMWSLPADWDYSVAGLVTLLKEGKSAITEALKELESEGYLVRTILRKGGKFSDIDYILYEVPQKSPFTDFPSTVFPSAENQPQLNTKETKEETTEDPFPTEKGKAQKKKKSYSEIFDDPQNESVKEALIKFVNVCRNRNIRFQQRTLERWAKILRDNAGSDSAMALAMVDQSIENGWKDIYPLKKKYQQQSNNKTAAVSIPASKEDKARNPDGSYATF